MVLPWQVLHKVDAEKFSLAVCNGGANEGAEEYHLTVPDRRRGGGLLRSNSFVLHEIPAGRLAVHFHDTYGQGLANLLPALERGIRTIDCSVAGLGGCPYAPGASGNVASEEVVYLLHGLGMSTGVDLDQLAATGQWVSELLGRPNGSRVGQALHGRGRRLAQEREQRPPGGHHAS